MENFLTYTGTRISKGMYKKARAKLQAQVAAMRKESPETADQLQRYVDTWWAAASRGSKAGNRRWYAAIEAEAKYIALREAYLSPKAVAARKEAAEQAAALERQRQELARLNTYQSNVGHGDLTGPGTPPTVISGGSQNVDTSRLDIGRSSTARRRRGRGISAQLGL